MARAFAEIAFTPGVLAAQEKNGSASAYARALSDEVSGGDRLDLQAAQFIVERDGFYQASVSETGWPYVQFKGGSTGFLKVLDDRQIAYADFRGNRQYLSLGNLATNDRVFLFLMDYPNRRRLKIWGRAKLVEREDDPDLIAQLQDPTNRARVERAVVITVEALDWNCPQHIPQRLTVEEFEGALAPLRDELEVLRAENDRLRRAQAQNID